MLEIESQPLPQICQQCLGHSKTHRLVRDSAKNACRLCKTPFVAYHWKLTTKLTKKTLICNHCAEKSDACQSCIRDIQYSLPLDLRDTALRILYEEGGSKADHDAVLAAVKESYAPSVSTSPYNHHQRTPESEAADIISRLPEVVVDMNRPESCDTLCVYGIEEDLDSDFLRSYFKSPIKRLDYQPASRLAFFQFDGPPPLSEPFALIDGRKLEFAWCDYVSIPADLQPIIGNAVKRYLIGKRKQSEH